MARSEGNAFRILLLAGAAAVALTTPGAAQEVGRAGAVNPAARAIPPGASGRTLELGQRVIRNERIQTTSAGSVQLVFLDKTTLNIGPNSDLVIDEFVYDPNTGTGRMATTLARGVLRFVGGQTSHTNGATVRTPASTLGIRGGVATITHGQNGTRAINHFGRLSVTTQGGTDMVRRPGFVISIPNLNVPPTPPIRVTQAEINAANRQLGSSSGQSGGSNRKPTQTQAQNSGIAQGNSQLDPQNVVVAQNQNVAKQNAQYVREPILNNVTQQTRELSTEASQASAAESTAQSRKSTVARAFALRVIPDANLGSGVPYLPSAFAVTGSYNISPVLGYRGEGTKDNGDPKTARFLQAGLSINGQGTAQTSTFFVATGAVTDDASGEPALSGGFRATTRRAANLSLGRAAGAISSQPGALEVDTDGIPVAGVIDQNDITPNGSRLSNTAFYSPGGGGASQDYGYQQRVEAVTPPSGLGENRPDGAFFTWLGGLVRTLRFPNATAQTGTFLGPAFPVVGIGYIFLDPADSRVQANFSITNDNPDIADTFDTGDFQLGNLDRTQRSRGTYLDLDNFAAREAIVETDPNSNSGVPLTTVNGSSVTRSRLAMVTSGTVGAKTFFPNTAFCDCEFTRWGFWSLDVNRPAPGGQVDSDRGHLLTWVAGLFPATPIPTVGTATYGGHIIGTFRDNNNEYVAAGQFANTVNFATGVGNFTVTGLDQRNYAGTVNFSPGTPIFAGSGSTTFGPTADIDLVGNFFGSATNPAAEMAGNFTIGNYGPTYVGSGIFQAKR